MSNGTATPRTLKSFKVVCPMCLATDAAITLDLNDLTAISCGECSETFTAETAVKAMTENLRRWQAVANLIALAGDCLAATTTPE
jgi:hypothetical protein